MKNIFELIIGALGLSICMLSAQIAAFTWKTYNPFYYIVPYESEQQNTAADEIATDDTSFALDSAGRSFIDTLALLNLQRQLTQLQKELEQLAAQREIDLNAIQTKLNVKATKADLDDTKKTVKGIASNLDTIQIQLNEKATKADLDDTKTTVKGIASNLDTIQIQLNEKATKADLDDTKTTVDRLASNLLTLTQRFENQIAVVDIGHMPESCTDLKTIGYKMNGFFQIKGTTQLENVYCDFTSNAQNLQKWIG